MRWRVVSPKERAASIYSTQKQLVENSRPIGLKDAELRSSAVAETEA